MVSLGWLAGCQLYDPQLLAANEQPVAGRASVSASAELPPEVCDAQIDPACACDREDCAAGPNRAAPLPPDTAPPQIAPPSAASGGSPAAVAASVMSADTCPNDPAKTAPGVCGCGMSERDRDADGTPDCVDACPEDAAKTAVGACGCGQPELDVDEDGTPDCRDGCPRDPEKTGQGVCGCERPDHDRDADGTPDCTDECPDDRDKTEPGACGCGLRDPQAAGAGMLSCSRALLRHRYSFEASDQRALDSVGSAHGAIYAAVQAEGSLRFAGDRGPGYRGEGYATLPAAAWHAGSVTVEAWVTWASTGDANRDQWQRVFDFAASGQQNAADANYLFLTLQGKGGVRAVLQIGRQEIAVTAPVPAKRNVVQHFACVLDADAGTLTLYVDGARQGTAKAPGNLSQLLLDDLWLGRSHYQADPALHGELHELRIYAGALDHAQLQSSARLGPSYDFGL